MNRRKYIFCSFIFLQWLDLLNKLLEEYLQVIDLIWNIELSKKFMRYPGKYKNIKNHLESKIRVNIYRIILQIIKHHLD